MQAGDYMSKPMITVTPKARRSTAGKGVEQTVKCEGCVDKLPTVTLEIPLDLVDTVIRALYRSADWYRADKGHSPEDIVLLCSAADRLETMAELLDVLATCLSRDLGDR